MYAFVFCFLWASQMGDVPAEFTVPVVESVVSGDAEGTPAATATEGTPTANATSSVSSSSAASTETPAGAQGESSPAVETTPVVVTEEATPAEVFVSITRVRHFLRDLVAANQRSGGSCAECFDLDVPPAEAIPKTPPTLPEEISAKEPAVVPELKIEEIDPYVIDSPTTSGLPAGVAGNGQTVSTPAVEEQAAAVPTVEGQASTEPAGDGQNSALPAVTAPAAVPAVEGQTAAEAATPKTPEPETLAVNVPNAPTAPETNAIANGSEAGNSQADSSKTVAEVPGVTGNTASTGHETLPVETTPATVPESGLPSAPAAPATPLIAGTPSTSKPTGTSELPPTFERVPEGQASRVPMGQTAREVPLVAPALLNMDTNDAEPLQHVINEEPLLSTVQSAKPGITSEEGTRSGQEVSNAPNAQVARPWGALTFVVFLLLLSLSANVFLGWQLWDKKQR